MAEDLAALRKTYDEAQDSLSIEYATEFGEGIALRNAIEAADELIAAQQQRIAELEAGLGKLVDNIYEPYIAEVINGYRGDIFDWINNFEQDNVINNFEAWLWRGKNLLHGEKGGEG